MVCKHAMRIKLIIRPGQFDVSNYPQGHRYLNRPVTAPKSSLRCLIWRHNVVFAFALHSLPLGLQAHLLLEQQLLLLSELHLG